MKKAMIIIVVLAFIGLAVYYFFPKQQKLYTENNLSYVAKVEGKDFYVYEKGEWKKKFLRGVNIGAAKPGTFPGELAITKEEYLRWFQYIQEMNTDVIRVYTTLKPEFYEALYEFNKKADKPLYLIQGVWVREEQIAELNDAYEKDGAIKKEFIEDAKNLVDIIHGNAKLPKKRGFASGTYEYDVSPYVIGWILGIEWDPMFVKETNEKNVTKKQYVGAYVQTEGASPFEIFLAEVGDEVLSYEGESYETTRPLAFTNWVTTDMLEHPGEPNYEEDVSVVNTEHIKATNFYPSGMFASYHVYPYYPDFFNYEKKYTSFKDEDGKVNTYKAYLRDLIKEHESPVIVSEFGVPASRGKAHDSLYSGYNQGNHDETEQGHILVSLLQDIYDEGYAGAFVFSWQDEWFKRTWNTMDFDLSDQRPFWSNVQTNEQYFGLLAFDPGKTKSISYVDGDISDWKKNKPIYNENGIKFFIKSDEKYVYMMMKAKDFDFEKDTVLIPIDTIQDQGNLVDERTDAKFDLPADFLIRIDGERNSRIVVDAYYDSFYYLYGNSLKMITRNEDYEQKGSGIFNSMYLALSHELFLPELNKTASFSKYETGKLMLGDANPKHTDFNSLTDFAVKDDVVEIRIPWQLLNVMDPSTKMIMGDLYKNKEIKAETTKGLSIGVAVMKNDNKLTSPIKMELYKWKEWYLPTYHERLKPSYYILKDAFGKIH